MFCDFYIESSLILANIDGVSTDYRAGIKRNEVLQIFEFDSLCLADF